MSNVAGHHTMTASLLDHPKQGRIEISEQDQLLLAVSVQLDRCHLTGVATHHGRTLQQGPPGGAGQLPRWQYETGAEGGHCAPAGHQH